MGNIVNMSAINSGDAVLAEPVSNNFSQIVAAINSNALDGNNYGESTIKSQHISTNAILAAHLTAGAVVSQKIATEAVIHPHINYKSSDNGVRFVRIGASASDMPASGVEMARVTGTLAVAASTATFSVAWSSAMEGDPAFTAPPEPMGMPGWKVSDTDHHAPRMLWVTAITDTGVTVSADWSAALTATLTYHMMAVGPK